MSDTIKLSSLKPNPDNPRVIRDHKFEKLCESIKNFPKMMKLRPIVVDAENIILGGNMRLRALQFLGYKEIPAEWVKKASDLTDEEKKQFIVKDNVGFGEWDWEDLANNWDADKLEEWGLDIPLWGNQENQDNQDNNDKENIYTKKIDIPIYEPKNEKPKIEDLYDEEKTNSLIDRIKKSNADEITKKFLINAAHRHRVFNYSKIADFYAHSDKEIQGLMEESALVISIDGPQI